MNDHSQAPKKKYEPVFCLSMRTDYCSRKGLMGLRLADAPVLPFNYTEYTQQLFVYFSEGGLPLLLVSVQLVHGCFSLTFHLVRMIWHHPDPPTSLAPT